MSELIDREALKDAVKRYAGEPIKEKDRKCQAICLDMLGTIDAQPAAPRWHRCEEQLPPNDGKEVLVTDGFHVGIGICMYKWSKTKKWTQEAVWYKWNLNDYGYPMKKFKTDTHIKAWMPLPEPPKEDA